MSTHEPKRIVLERRKDWHMPAGTVKVDRSTKWGNPFRIVEGVWPADMFCCMTREEATTRFQFGIMQELRTGQGPAWAKVILRDIHELEGKNIGCWCKEHQNCHGDILLLFADPKMRRHLARGRKLLAGRNSHPVISNGAEESPKSSQEPARRVAGQPTGPGGPENLSPAVMEEIHGKAGKPVAERRSSNCREANRVAIEALSSPLEVTVSASGAHPELRTSPPDSTNSPNGSVLPVAHLQAPGPDGRTQVRISLGDMYAGSCRTCGRRGEYGIASKRGPEGCVEAVQSGMVFCKEHIPPWCVRCGTTLKGVGTGTLCGLCAADEMNARRLEEMCGFPDDERPDIKWPNGRKYQ